MSGIVGRFMQSFGLTMAFAVLVSLLVSFTLTPMMCARWLKLKATGPDGTATSRLEALEDLWTARSRLRAHARLVDGAPRHRGRAAVLVLLSSVPLFRLVSVNFTPQDDQSEFDVSAAGARGHQPRCHEVMANRVATAIRRIPEVDYTMVTVAGDGRARRTPRPSSSS